MAQLFDKPYPGDWAWRTTSDGFDYDDECKRTDDMFAAIDQDRIVRFPVADGYALYYVKSLKPLVLQHIPYGDAWQIPYAHIRGLRLADVQQQIEGNKRMRELFSSRKEDK